MIGEVTGSAITAIKSKQLRSLAKDMQAEGKESCFDFAFVLAPGLAAPINFPPSSPPLSSVLRGCGNRILGCPPNLHLLVYTVHNLFPLNAGRIYENNEILTPLSSSCRIRLRLSEPKENLLLA